jgi:hypothetical protein
MNFMDRGEFGLKHPALPILTIRYS